MCHFHLRKALALNLNDRFRLFFQLFCKNCFSIRKRSIVSKWGHRTYGIYIESDKRKVVWSRLEHIPPKFVVNLIQWRSQPVHSLDFPRVPFFHWILRYRDIHTKNCWDRDVDQRNRFVLHMHIYPIWQVWLDLQRIYSKNSILD